MPAPSAGESTEGRDIKVVEVGRGSRYVWIDGGIHARLSKVDPGILELNIPGSGYRLHQSCTCFARWWKTHISMPTSSVTSHSSSAQGWVYRQLDQNLPPSINPDGYEYSRNYDRMWRKTRSRTSGRCVGVDGNRNWSYEWGGRVGTAHIWPDNLLS